MHDFNKQKKKIMEEELSHRDKNKILYKRALVYSGVSNALFIFFLLFAVELYFFNSIRVANIAFSLAFVGLLVFVTLTGIAFLTIFDMGNEKE